MATGILNVKDNHPKRLLKQISQTITGGYLRQTMSQQDNYGLAKDKNLCDLLAQMLNSDPS